MARVSEKLPSLTAVGEADVELTRCQFSPTDLQGLK